MPANGVVERNLASFVSLLPPRRKVDKDRTVSLHGRMCEAPVGAGGPISVTPARPE